MHKAHGRHDDAPEKHDDRNEDGWSETFEQNLSQRLKSGIGDEEDGQGQVVLRTCHVQIFGEASDFGIADVGTIQEGREVKQTEPWYQFEIEFPKEFAVLSPCYCILGASQRGVCTILARSSALNPSSGSGIASMG
jgi:hypothetical protein